VIWLGITAGEESLVRIHREIESRLGPLGFEAENRPYRAHLTVGRVKGPLPGRPRDVLAEMALRPVGRCRVGHVTLFESRLSPKGPTYTPLVTTPLAG
jgi:2'-5' RNA ligase